MNTFERILVLCLILYTFCVSSALAGIEEELDQLEEKRYAAFIAGDWASLDSLLADEFFYNQGTGASVTKSVFLASLKAGDVKMKKATREDTQIQIYDNVAVVTGVAHVDVTLKGEDKTLHMRYLHVWSNKGAGWKLVARQSTYIPDKR